MRTYDRKPLTKLLRSQWYLCKNNFKQPEEFRTRDRPWWICPLGHDWQATIADRMQGAGCIYCTNQKAWFGFNDLMTLFPCIAATWHNFLNAGVFPRDVTAHSGRKYWWRCPLNHEYKTTVAHRVNDGRGCPFCSGLQVLLGFNDLWTTHPNLAKEWHPDNKLSPYEVSAGMGKKVKWLCPEGHSYWAWIYHRSSKAQEGCSVCRKLRTRSKGELQLKSFLKAEGYEIKENSRSVIPPYEVDIFMPQEKIAIEFNGSFWHSDAKNSDNNYHKKKYELARLKGIALIQIWEDEWVNTLEEVKRYLLFRLSNEETFTDFRITDEQDAFNIINSTTGTQLAWLQKSTGVLKVTRASEFLPLLPQIISSMRALGVPMINILLDNCKSEEYFYERNGFILEEELPCKPFYVRGVNRIDVQSAGKLKSLPKNKVWDAGEKLYGLSFGIPSKAQRSAVCIISKSFEICGTFFV